MTNDTEQLKKKAWNKKPHKSYWFNNENVAQRSLRLEDKAKLKWNKETCKFNVYESMEDGQDGALHF